MIVHSIDFHHMIISNEPSLRFSFTTKLFEFIASPKCNVIVCPTFGVLKAILVNHFKFVTANRFECGDLNRI